METLADKSYIIPRDTRTFLRRLPLFVLALLVFGVGLASYVHELRLPALGFNWNNTDGVVFAVREGGPAEQAGLQRGDIFLRLEGVPLDARDEFRQAWKEIKGHQTASIAIERGGQETSLTFAVEAMPPFLEGYGIYYLIALVFWIAGVLAYLSRGQDRVATVYLVFCLAAAVASFTNTNVNVSFIRWASVLQRVSTGLVVGLFLHFSIIFPEEKRIGRKWRIPILALFYLPGLVLGCLNAYLFPLQLKGEFNLLFDLLFLSPALSFLGWIASLVHTYLTTPSAEVREQLREMGGGITLTLLPFIVMLVSNVLAGRALVDARIVATSAIAFPMALTYAILKQRSLLDVDRLVRWGLVYTMLGIAVVVIYLVAVGVLARLFRVAISWGALLIALVSAIIVAFVVAPLRNRLQTLVNRLFWR
ncbi:MAG: PDZ domain-containing protein [Anaerolineales bacterium]|nr:PDZ domain-containing protein [Anaerolineales bacterium]